MPPKRPTIISVIGILNISFGSLGLFFTLCCGVIGLFANNIVALMLPPQAPGQITVANPMSQLSKTPAYFAFQCAGLAMALVTSSLLVASGIGFMKMKKWGRVAGLIYAIVGILWGISATMVNQRLAGPRFIEFIEQMEDQIRNGPPQAPNPFPQPGKIEINKEAEAQKANAAGQSDHSILLGFYFAFVLLMSLAYPVVELVLMMLPAVKNGLAGKTDPAWEPDPLALDDKPESNNVGQQ